MVGRGPPRGAPHERQRQRLAGFDPARANAVGVEHDPVVERRIDLFRRHVGWSEADQRQLYGAVPLVGCLEPVLGQPGRDHSTWIDLSHRPRHQPDAVVLGADRLEAFARVLRVNRPLGGQADHRQLAVIVVVEDLDLVRRDQHHGVGRARLPLDLTDETPIVVACQRGIEILG